MGNVPEGVISGTSMFPMKSGMVYLVVISLGIGWPFQTDAALPAPLASLATHFKWSTSTGECSFTAANTWLSHRTLG
jgi:hypothetical protein